MPRARARTRKPPADQEDYPLQPPVYILSYNTNNEPFFILPSEDDIISVHKSRTAAIEAGRTWIASMLEQQKQLEEDRSRRVRWEDELGWHTGEWEHLDGSWKSMINAKGGFRDLVICVRRYEASYVKEDLEDAEEAQ